METIDTLVELGLTLNEARIYFALLHLQQPATVKEISEITKITRQDVYRILPTLQKDGLVEKTITAPTMFKATPIKLGTSVLIKNKVRKDNELIEKAKSMSNETFEKQTLIDSQPEFVLIPENDAVVQKINSITATIQTSLDIVTSKKRFPRAIIEFFDARMQAMQRGARIRVVTETLTSTNGRIEKIMAIERKAGVLTKYLPTPPPVLLLLFDNKQVMIITSSIGTLETSALWSTNSSLVELSKSYFEKMWNSATETS
jgi:sugar-specific transcriptional regulator TrmB